MNALTEAPDSIQGKKITYRNSDGEIAKNGVAQFQDQDGELRFYELLGQTGIDGIPYVKINGKQKFRRIMIRQVYPTIEVAS